ncbi:MAG: hypothetical protein WCW84_07930 [Sulfurimonas sp.]|jgi:predicted RNA-binding Zn-ribbon protein involved in translation (DUF1610 family)
MQNSILKNKLENATLIIISPLAASIDGFTANYAGTKGEGNSMRFLFVDQENNCWEITEDEIDEIINDEIVETINELCPHCNNEVKLEAEFVVQKCPECNKTILPCSICPVAGEVNACINCPLSPSKKKCFSVDNYTQEELIKMEFAGHFVHATEEQVEAAMQEIEAGLTTAEAVKEVLVTFNSATVVEIKNPLESFTVRELLDEIRKRAMQENVVTSASSLCLMTLERAKWNVKDQLHNCTGVDIGNDNYYIDPQEYVGESDLDDLVQRANEFGIGLINVY